MKMYDMVAIAKCNIIMKNGFMVRCNMPYQGLIDENEFNRLKEYFLIKSAKEVVEDLPSEQLKDVVILEDQSNHITTNNIQTNNFPINIETPKPKVKSYVKKVRMEEVK